MLWAWSTFFSILPRPPSGGTPDLGVLCLEFEYDAGQIQADPRPAGDVPHGSRLVDPFHARSESPGLDVGSQRADHRCTPRAEGDPGGCLPSRIDPLHPRDLNGPSRSPFSCLVLLCYTRGRRTRPTHEEVVYDQTDLERHLCALPRGI